MEYLRPTIKKDVEDIFCETDVFMTIPCNLNVHYDIHDATYYICANIGRMYIKEQFRECDDLNSLATKLYNEYKRIADPNMYDSVNVNVFRKALNAVIESVNEAKESY